MPLSYERVHHRLALSQGRAGAHICGCGKLACDWAYQHTAGDAEIVDKDGLKYSENPEDYKPMCKPCHVALDMEHNPESWFRTYAPGKRYSGPRTHPNRQKPSPEDQHKASAAGGRGVAERFKTDPDFAQQKRGHLSAGSKLNRKCGGCDRVSNAGGLAKHQTSTGHEGVVILDGVS